MILVCLVIRTLSRHAHSFTRPLVVPVSIASQVEAIAENSALGGGAANIEAIIAGLDGITAADVNAVSPDDEAD